jgi:hypothetical protein
MFITKLLNVAAHRYLVMPYLSLRFVISPWCPRHFFSSRAVTVLPVAVHAVVLVHVGLCKVGEHINHVPSTQISKFRN